jgi:hypothetical protein
MLSDMFTIITNTVRSKTGGISVVICRECSQTYIYEITEAIPDCPRCYKPKEEILDDSETE